MRAEHAHFRDKGHPEKRSKRPVLVERMSAQMKWFGAAAITGCCYYIGLIIAKQEQTAHDQLASLVRLLRFMQQRISFSREKLGDIFADYTDIILTDCGFLPALNSALGEPYSKRWVRAVQTLSVSAAVKKELTRFGEQLGRLDFESQTQQLALCKGFLELEQQKGEAGLEKRQKSIRMLGGLSGALLSILLF